jgi:hypothetical protein
MKSKLFTLLILLGLLVSACGQVPASGGEGQSGDRYASL